MAFECSPFWSYMLLIIRQGNDMPSACHGKWLIEILHDPETMKEEGCVMQSAPKIF
jgi:hypothetical protein